MARKKSFNDIVAQRNRIQAEIARRLGMRAADPQSAARYRRVSEIAQRYMDNIAQSKSAKRMINSVNKKLVLTREEFEAYRKRARNRKYSQSTYMGRANG